MPRNIDQKQLIEELERLEEERRRRDQKGKPGCYPNQYCPHKPHPKQQLFLDLDHEREVLYGGSVGGGKLLVLEYQLVTPTGWVTMADVRPGDYVIDADGNPCKVTWISDIVDNPDSYELELSDGEKIVCDAGHQWLTVSYDERHKQLVRDPEWQAARRVRRPKRGGNGIRLRPDLAERNSRLANERREKELLLPTPPLRGSVRTTAEIVSTLHKKFKNRVQPNHSIVNASPLNLPDAELIVPPYTMGAWLGDGDSNCGGLTGIDPGIWEEIEKDGFSVSHHKCEKRHHILGLLPYLKRLGVHNNKHIPNDYLRASLQQRIALLQGLCDTDGYCCKDKGSVEFTTTSSKLRDGFMELLATLGIKGSCNPGFATLDGRVTGPKWRIQFWTDIPAFRLKRKLDRQKTSGFRGIHDRRHIVSAKKVPPVPMRCIAVDSPSHTYLVGRAMIPTHNSDALLMAALKYVHVPGYSALILRRSYSDLALPNAIMSRAQSWLANSDATWRAVDKQFVFPSGAKITFGYLALEQQKYRYASSEYQCICFDESTQFPISHYTFMFSRLRGPQDPSDQLSKVPLRMRSATNPGSISHEAVRQRFGIPDQIDFSKIYRHDGRVFVPSRLDDNPSLNAEEYDKMLAELAPAEREQLRHGRWVRDASMLVFPYFNEDCLVDDVPELERFVLGVDFGLRDATAFTVIGWRAEDPCAYIVHMHKATGLSPSDAAEIITDLSNTYPFERIVGDSQGLGTGYVEEAKRRFGIAIEGAEKNNKRGYIELLNGAVANGKLKVLRGVHHELYAETSSLPWKDENREKAHEGFENHLCDSLLYGWRACYNYLEKTSAALPEKGTPEHRAMVNETMKEERRVTQIQDVRSRSGAWWQTAPSRRVR